MSEVQTSGEHGIAGERTVSPNFITAQIDQDLAQGKVGRVVTRFPPEPNGYLHLGHTFACFLDFQIALDYGGSYHLRLDDTNPEGESEEFARNIVRDLSWLGYDWGDQLFYASDYFGRYYEYAEQLVRQGAAYVDSVSPGEMSRLRGTLDTPGRPSPYRERSVEENLDLLRRMRAGEFPDGAHVLRAKIDLASPNMKLRDPVLYRILRAHHYRTGDDWCIYPMYDFQHPLQDAIEGVTHSLCSLEYVDNRAIYDWLMAQLFPERHPHQYEFGRRSLEYTVVSKRKLRQLVAGGFVGGWDDPRMPTLAGQRRKGVTPEALRAFAAQIGVSRTNRTVDLALYENAVRDDLNARAPRVMAVLHPLRVVLKNLETEQMLPLPYWPRDVVDASPDGLVALPSGERVPPGEAVRTAPLTREIYIEQSDFASEPPPGWKRLIPGGTVRLRGAGVVRCDEVVTGASGELSHLICTLLPQDARARGVIHWVSAARGVAADFRLYDRLFTVPLPEAQANEDQAGEHQPDEGQAQAVQDQLRQAEPGAEENPEDGPGDFLAYVNPRSLETARGFVEPSVLGDPPGTRYQFERVGYFWRDPEDGRGETPIFNRIVGLKDSWEGHGAGARRPEEQPAEKKAAQPQNAEIALTPGQQSDADLWRARGVGEAEAAVLAREPQLAAYLEEAAAHAPAGQAVGALASWVVNDLGGPLRDGTNRVTPRALADLVRLIEGGTITARIAKDMLARAQRGGEAPADIVARENLRQVSDAGELEAAVEAALAAHPDKLAEYRAGRTGLLGFFTGQVMKATGGRANPQVLREVLERRLMEGGEE